MAPAVLGGFAKQAQAHPQGPAGLGGLLSQLGGGGLLDAVLSPSPTDTDPGNNVLGQIFGSKDVSRAVAQDAAAQTGQNPSVLKRMLPMLAMIVVGYMAKQHAAASSSGSGGGLDRLLGSLLGGQSPAASSGGLGGLLNMGGQRNPLDDIMGRLGR